MQRYPVFRLMDYNISIDECLQDNIDLVLKSDKTNDRFTTLELISIRGCNYSRFILEYLLLMLPNWHAIHITNVEMNLCYFTRYYPL